MSNFTNSPDTQAFNQLFIDVQLSNIFPDSKTFNDYIPKFDEASIIEKYTQTHVAPDFDLSKFIHENYQANSQTTNEYKSDTSKPIAQHLEDLWPILTREPEQQEANGSLIRLPSRYVVPGGRFQEIY